jgi:hypothetical protein
MALLDASADRLDLKFTEGDPLSFAFSVADVDWSGTYLAQIRTAYDAATVATTLTVVATFNTPNTDFTMTASAAANTLSPGSPAGVWDLQVVGGATRLSGRVIVEPQVSHS